MFLKIKQAIVISAVIGLGFSFGASNVLAQGGIDPVPVPDTGTQGGQVLTPAPTQNTGSNTTSVGTNNTQGVGDLGSAIELDEIFDTRNQGFVGATAPGILFVGRPGEFSGPPLATGATFGGGVNNAITNNILIGGGGGNARQGAAGFGAAANGVTVTRRSLRAKLQPSFYAPRPSEQQVAARFTSRIALQPGPQSAGSGYTIKVQDRTAYLSGSVNSQSDSDRLVRQLRLEPGVYKVVNQLQILN